jgi:hypothetical protein
MNPREKLESEIKKLEALLEKDHFRGVVDLQSRKREENRLKKLRKELEELNKKGQKE